MERSFRLYSHCNRIPNAHDRYTPWFDIDCGVKQGCLLSPPLFAIYSNDLSERINSLQCGVNIGGGLLSILLYANDITLIAPNEESPQRMLNVVSDWYTQWKR